MRHDVDLECTQPADQQCTVVQWRVGGNVTFRFDEGDRMAGPGEEFSGLGPGTAAARHQHGADRRSYGPPVRLAL